MLEHREVGHEVEFADMHASDESSDEGVYYQTVAVGGRQGGSWMRRGQRDNNMFPGLASSSRTNRTARRKKNGKVSKQKGAHRQTPATQDCPSKMSLFKLPRMPITCITVT